MYIYLNNVGKPYDKYMVEDRENWIEEAIVCVR